MADFVNKVKKNDVEYEIQDARIPEATAEDAGKVLKVADAGGYELGEAGGGTQLYLHDVLLQNSETNEKLLLLIISTTASVFTSVSDFCDDASYGTFHVQSTCVISKARYAPHQWTSPFPVGLINCAIDGGHNFYAMICKKTDGGTNPTIDIITGVSFVSDTVTAL